MATIVTRAGKGSPLTHSEVDANFENLNSDKVETSSVSAFGATLIDDADAATARTTLGLGTAATTASTDYATAAQGALADSAVQPNDSPTFGSITVTGTVDGRDVASDGTKLDGIEAGADVTDATNVAAAGALMTSGGTMTGQLTINNANGNLAMQLNGTSPTISFNDTDHDSFYIHVNSNNFYILADRDGTGAYNTWESPHPMMLEADTNNGYLWGNLMMHVGLGVGAVGTYAWLQRNATNTYVTPGSTYAGSGFFYAGTSAAAWTINADFTSFDDEAGDWMTGPGTSYRTAPAGTWRCMGESSPLSSLDYPSSLFLRIS